MKKKSKRRGSSASSGLAKEPLCKICRIYVPGRKRWERAFRNDGGRWEGVPEGREIEENPETRTEGTPGRAADEPESELKELEDGMEATVGLEAGEWSRKIVTLMKEASSMSMEQVDNEIKGPNMKANAVIWVWSDRDETKAWWWWQMWQALWRSITRTDWHSGTVILNTRSRS